MLVSQTKDLAVILFAEHPHQGVNLKDIVYVFCSLHFSALNKYKVIYPVWIGYLVGCGDDTGFVRSKASETIR